MAEDGVNTSENKRIRYQERIKMFEDEIAKPVLDLKKIREISFYGIPEGSLRAIYWKVLLHYLPVKQVHWPSELQKNRQLYQEFKIELIVNPRKDYAASPVSKPQQVDDHPLSRKHDSQWNTYFKDNDMIADIEKDVRRTFPYLHFFQQPHNDADTLDLLRSLHTLSGPRDESEGNIHYIALKRILFIWCKLNPGISYVQGMNEIVGPIYYLFATDAALEWREHAEADAFFCFTNLMAEIRDNFCKSLDSSDMGIVNRIHQLNELLKKKDLELWQDLENKKLNPQFYSFRWLTLLLSQEFELPDVLRLWDSLFSDTNRFEFLLYVCCAMLIAVREKLFDGDFADNLKMLQQYPPTDLHTIITLATEVKEQTWRAPPREERKGASLLPHMPKNSPPNYSATGSPPTSHAHNGSGKVFNL
jgi:hypothetical protein